MSKVVDINRRKLLILFSIASGRFRYREIGEFCGLKSVSTVEYYLRRFEEVGWIESERYKTGITLTPSGIDQLRGYAICGNSLWIVAHDYQDSGADQSL